ncbi:MAG: DEAD/DEAH box helicase [Trueperaceae bacterium]|nr:DEAD/DEAH box helicase [Trueperaceae bacterium]
MDIFAFRDKLTTDYTEYARSFINVSTPDVRARVEGELRANALWPEPLVQLNPAFAPGAGIPDLVEAGTLHSVCAQVFRHGKTDKNPGVPLDLYKHQVEAIAIAKTGSNYVVTTGTGSGKSLTYMIPIVDHVLRVGTGNGIKAIVVYPMNALANSQAGELEKFLDHGFGGRPPVSYARFTGQDDEATRTRIKTDPPDILLTNYVMLKLILTRGNDKTLVNSAASLRFIVFDELHTYRGRQGADVAMLIRRARDRMGGSDLQCIGTSATMGSRGTVSEQRHEVARVASTIFGAPVAPGNVVGETLRRVTTPVDLTDPALPTRLKASLSNIESLTKKPFAEFVQDPLCGWVESTLGVRMDPESNTLVRQSPQRLTGPIGVAAELERLTGLHTGSCEVPLKRLLTAGYEVVEDPAASRPLRAFAFRLHQFYNRGETVYSSLELPTVRHLTLKAQRLVPDEPGKVLMPLAFCRECGHEYYTVWRSEGDGAPKYTPRSLGERQAEDKGTPGYLYFSMRRPWPEAGSMEELESLPNDWLEVRHGELRVKYDRRKKVPTAVTVQPDGTETPAGTPFHFVPANLSFCLHCGVHYPAGASEYTTLGVLGTGGRSTATTVLSLSAVRQLQGTEDLPKEARKILSFTDNRQDASLQAGHLNDFVEVGLLRGALYKAVHDAGAAGLGFSEVAPSVFAALDLDLHDYAANVGEFVGTAVKNQAANMLREVLAYRLFRDLERGWRLTSPNLEQVGLLDLRYPDLDDASKQDGLWQGTHEALVTATPAQRHGAMRVLLDHLRRNLAIESEWLDPERQEQMKTRSRDYLKGRWGLDESESLVYHTTAYPRPSTKNERGKNIYLSGRSQYAAYLRRANTFPKMNSLTVEDSEAIIANLLERLASYGTLAIVQAPTRPSDVAGYRLRPSAMRWHAGDGQSPLYDPLRKVHDEDAGRVNPFFRRFYQETAMHLGGLEAREHTAQVPSAWREEREQQFRTAKLPILYCSPTMELGVDIAELNVVNLRNVPPTPANYAQRSGRAGRSGQPALVFTYCTTGSGHDQYYFARPERMVAGIVEPPRLDLANEDLVRAHVHSVWLSETGVELGRSLKEILDIKNESLPLSEQIRAELDNPHARRRATQRVENLLKDDLPALKSAAWYHAAWLNDTLMNAIESFDRACDRWRDLYRTAQAQFNAANETVADATKDTGAKAQAKRLRAEAENQMGLLTDNGTSMQGDFYSYRYFASEGFLPGYSFPRLPLAAYIPGRRLGMGNDEFVQRPRFLAISEFGPRALIYHEGSKYRVTRVSLSPDKEDESIASRRAIICSTCGYLKRPGFRRGSSLTRPASAGPGSDCKQPRTSRG